MKKAILFLMLFTVSVAFGQRNDMRKTEAKKEVDEMTGETLKKVNLSTVSLATSSESSIGLIQSENVSLMYSFVYKKDWLFVDEILIVIDGEKYTLKSIESKRDIESQGYITERNYFKPTPEILEAFKNAKEIKYRLIGKNNYLDFEIKEKKLSALNDFANI